MMLYVKRDQQRAAYCRLLQTVQGDYEIAYMRVDPEFRGMGLATQLLKRAMSVADRAGVCLVAFLEPDGTGLTKEQERRWLKRHGFRYEKRYDLSKGQIRTISQLIRHKPNYKAVMIRFPVE